MNKLQNLSNEFNLVPLTNVEAILDCNRFESHLKSLHEQKLRITARKKWLQENDIIKKPNLFTSDLFI